MPQTQTRRRVLTAIAAISAVTLPAPRLLAAEPAAEITSVRFGKIPVICFAPQYVCEELLRAEGFTEIRYVNAEPVNYSADLGRGKYDFCANVTPAHIAAIAAGASMAILAGIHAGCYELFGHDGIRGIADLKGKRVGTGAAADLIEIMAAYVGLDPKKDVTIVLDPSGKALDEFALGKLDAYMGLPPEPQLLHARGFTPQYDYALQTLNENPYGHWRDYDAEDSVRFYALRQYELGTIKKTPQRVIAEGTDWRFLNELKRELKA